VLTTRSNDPSGNASEAASPTRKDGRLAALPHTVGVGSGPLDHGWIEVETRHVEAVLASKPDRQAARPATNLEHPCAVRGDRRDVGSDAPEERAEQEPVAQRVVGAGIADEDASRHPSPCGGTADMSHDGDGRCGPRGRSEQDHEGSIALRCRHR
jgi:hypothetical protein